MSGFIADTKPSIGKEVLDSRNYSRILEIP